MIVGALTIRKLAFVVDSLSTSVANEFESQTLSSEKVSDQSDALSAQVFKE